METLKAWWVANKIEQLVKFMLFTWFIYKIYLHGAKS